MARMSQQHWLKVEDGVIIMLPCDVEERHESPKNRGVISKMRRRFFPTKVTMCSGGKVTLLLT